MTYKNLGSAKRPTFGIPKQELASLFVVWCSIYSTSLPLNQWCLPHPGSGSPSGVDRKKIMRHGSGKIGCVFYCFLRFLLV